MVETPDPGSLAGDPIVVFASDFGTATGLTMASVTDGGKWNGSCNGCLEGTGSVVNAASEGIASLGWPSTNALKVAPVRSSAFIPRADGWAIPAVGESIYYRFYFIWVGTTSTGSAEHPIQPVTAMDVPWMFQMDNVGGGRWEANWFIIGNSPDAPAGGDVNMRKFHPPIDLPANTVYRFELQYERTGDTTWRPHFRTYDSAGNLLWDDDSYVNANNTATRSSYTVDFNSVNPAALNTLQAGINGFGEFTVPFTHSYQGAFAVCRNDWCGPYVPGEAN